MDDLAWRALTGLLKFQIALALLIFGPALTLNFWQGWLYWCLMLVISLAGSLYFLKADPALVARRLNAGPTAEREPRQKLIQSVASIAVCAIIVVSALDHLFGWSYVPTGFVLAGNAIFVLGYAFIFVVFRENSFASSIIEVGAGQRVIDTGPYALVRHPMYVGAIVMFFATPIALGSLWGLVPALILAVAITWRLLDEEEYLARNLAGYGEYRARVRWRLVPGLW
jgi:protein-S-isoprenylcysteine O-methyltransferase Ste14